MRVWIGVGKRLAADTALKRLSTDLGHARRLSDRVGFGRRMPRCHFDLSSGAGDSGSRFCASWRERKNISALSRRLMASR